MLILFVDFNYSTTQTTLCPLTFFVWWRFRSVADHRPDLDMFRSWRTESVWLSLETRAIGIACGNASSLEISTMYCRKAFFAWHYPATSNRIWWKHHESNMLSLETRAIPSWSRWAGSSLSSNGNFHLLQLVSCPAQLRS
jgi:hypothetical protein